MSLDEKINRYYLEILMACNESDDVVRFTLDPYTKTIKQALKEIIEADNDYILSEGFIYYLANTKSKDLIVATLISLINKNNNIIFTLEYFDTIRSFETIYQENYFIGKFNIYEIGLYKTYANSRAIAAIDKSISYFETVFLDKIFQIIGAYVLAKRESKEDMSKYIGEYLYDWASKKDELIIQGICEEKYNRLLDCYDYSFDANKLATYVIGRINNEEKEIR